LIWTLFLATCIPFAEDDGVTEVIFHIQELGKLIWAELGVKKILSNFLFTLASVVRVLEHRRAVEVPDSSCLTVTKKLMNPQMEIFY